MALGMARLEAEVKAAIFETQQNAKAAALHDAQAQRIKALMGSITLLQKQKDTLLKATKEHARTEAFKKMETELGRQDAMLRGLMELFPKEKRAEVAKLANDATGPKRVTVKSRLELQLHIEELEHKLRTARAQRAPVAPKAFDAPSKDVRAMAEQLAGSRGQDQADLRRQRDLLQAQANEIQTMEVEIQALKMKLGVRPPPEGAPVSVSESPGRKKKEKRQLQLLQNVQRDRDELDRLYQEAVHEAEAQKVKVAQQEGRLVELEMDAKNADKKASESMHGRVLAMDKRHRKALAEIQQTVENKESTIRKLRGEEGKLRRQQNDLKKQVKDESSRAEQEKVRAEIMKDRALVLRESIAKVEHLDTAGPLASTIRRPEEREEREELETVDLNTSISQKPPVAQVPAVRPSRSPSPSSPPRSPIRSRRPATEEGRAEALVAAEARVVELEQHIQQLERELELSQREPADDAKELAMFRERNQILENQNQDIMAKWNELEQRHKDLEEQLKNAKALILRLNNKSASPLPLSDLSTRKSASAEPQVD